MKPPKVTVSLWACEDGEVRWSAACECGWMYRNFVKTDVQQQATWHRREHREALAVTQ
jgi:hypothetical protein